MDYSSLAYRGSYSRSPEYYLRVETADEILFELKLYVKDGYLWILPVSTNPELYKHIDNTRFKFTPTGSFVDLLDPSYGASKQFIGSDASFTFDFSNLALEATIDSDNHIEFNIVSGSKVLPVSRAQDLLSQVNPWKNDVLGYLLHGCMAEHEILPTSGDVLYILFPRVDQRSPVDSFIAYVHRSLNLYACMFDKDQNILVAIARNSEHLPKNLSEDYDYIQEMFMLH